jgi:formate-dependent nitrite reductase membrane component NrfD
MPFFTLSHEYFIYSFSMLLLFIIFPIAIVTKLLEIKEEHGDTLPRLALVKMNLSAIMVLVGGMIIRFTFVYAGQLSRFT